MTTPVRIIDGHQHPCWQGRDTHGLVRDMDEHGIAAAWLLTWEIPPGQDDDRYAPCLDPVNVRSDGSQAGITLRDILAARDLYPSRFIPGYCPDPAWPNAPAFLRSAARIHGVRICGEWKFRMLVNDPRCLELFRTAGELGMPVIVHLDVPYRPGPAGNPVYQRDWYGGTVEHLEDALKRCPATTFMGHAPGFWREISAGADQEPALYSEGPVSGPGRLYRLFDTYANLYGDLSADSAWVALARDPAHSREFLLRYADRMIFARDQYGQILFPFLQTLDLPQEVMDKICFQNAERLVPPRQ